ncbi:MAG: HlyD family secretion protein [Acidobacteria bacterium]|nr:HlyD family secretion protein [Acidobacteriota bacterium]
MKQDLAATENRLEEKTPSGGQPGPLFARRPRTMWVLLAASIGAAVGVFFLWRYYGVRESTDNAQIEGHIHAIGPRVGGTVAAVHVKDNQRVEGGTVLVEIDPRDYRVALQRAEAELAVAAAALDASRTDVPITSTTTSSRLASARAGVEEVRASLVSTEKEVAAVQARMQAAQARLREVEANYQRAERDLERMKLLIAKREISQQQYDMSVAAADALRAMVDSAQASIAEAEQNRQVAESRVERDRARLAQAQANLQAAQTAPQQVQIAESQAQSAAARVELAKAAVEQAKLNLEYTTIRAPLSGIVSRKRVEVGEQVQPGQLLMAIVPLDDIWVTANFKETQLRNMRPGQPAIISVDAYGGREYRGHVESIAAATGAKFSLLPPENASGNFVKVVQRIPVKIILEKGQDPEHLLRPGMSVMPTVMTQ